ncbi:hypothetical protein [Legionella jordanis]|uniref:Uncharacterized protein n=1 Tax=Legionella jordanis TaxID=456 RepID=A0A0W0VFZ5_9GAMM|nr:hypothetical protein [Legionella jordanis]KTD19040.1 hypothetical protein Ljor_0263 [Legionella jordanis]VEH13143.1 Uncharacterised protein [Legionella jordanis]
MFRLRERTLNAYVTQARTITVIKGNSGVLYPFYNSSGFNSKSLGTWFPWMGYLSYPNDDPSTHEVYMVKPVTKTVSEETAEIIKKHLKENADNFISRMGNDEAVAISCSLGGGEWDKFPKMREEIMEAKATSKFIKPVSNIIFRESFIEDLTETEKNTVIDFSGIACNGPVKNSHAKMASHMEAIINEESERYVSNYSIQQKKDFPSTDEVNERVQQLTHARELRERYVGSVTHMVQQEKWKEKAESNLDKGQMANKSPEGENSIKPR